MIKRPDMEYGEAPDMTVYQRREGDRLLVYVQKGWIDNWTIYNILEQRHENKYIDFIGMYDVEGRIKDMCVKLHISFIEYTESGYEAFNYMIDSIRPTKALLFYMHDNLEVNELLDALSNKNISTSILH